MPVEPAEPVVTAACVFCCRRAMGEAITRHFPRPPDEGDTLDASPRAFRAAGMRMVVPMVPHWHSFRVDASHRLREACPGSDESRGDTPCSAQRTTST